LIPYDGISHHALGGPSHTFKQNYTEYISRLITNGPSVDVNIRMQPNSSPHAGTLLSLIFAFSFSRDLQRIGYNPTVNLDLLDNSNSTIETINALVYQKGLRAAGNLEENLGDFYELAEILGGRYQVPYQVRFERDLMGQKGMSTVIRDIIRDRDMLGDQLSPSHRRIMVRAPCPVPNCGLVEKYAKQTEYDIEHDCCHFICPHHGPFTLSIENDSSRFQFNTELRTLIIGRFYSSSAKGYIEVSGSDFAGSWQEQVVWRHLQSPIIILYTPLIVDWSGSKISKSLYLRKEAYGYLRQAGQEYLCSYKVMKAQGKKIDVLCDEVDLWIREPYRLFRAYTLAYLHLLFEHPEQLHTGLIIFQKDEAEDQVGR